VKRQDVFELYAEDLITREGAAKLLNMRPIEFEEKYQRWFESKRWETLVADLESTAKRLVREAGLPEDYRVRILVWGGENPSTSASIRRIDPSDGGTRPVGRKGRWYIGESPASASVIYDALKRAGYAKDVAQKYHDIAQKYSPAESIRRMPEEMRQTIGAHQK